MSQARRAARMRGVSAVIILGGAGVAVWSSAFAQRPLPQAPPAAQNQNKPNSPANHVPPVPPPAPPPPPTPQNQNRPPPPVTRATIKMRPPILGHTNPYFWAQKRGAPAFQRPPRPNPIPDIGTCTVPNLARCQQPGFLATPCGKTHAKVCEDLLKAEFGRQYTASTADATVLPPDSMKGGGKFDKGKRLPYDKSRISVIRPATTSLTAKTQLAQLPARYPSVNPSVGADTSVQHKEFEPTVAGRPSVAVRSCEEFVYKKYYDYVRFEEAAATCKSDWVCVFNLAMRPTTPGINRLTLNKMHGRPMTVQLRPQTATAAARTFPRNAFYDDSPDRLVSGVTRPTFGAITQSTVREDARWQWHIDLEKSQRGYGMTAAEYADIETRTTQVHELWATYHDLKDSVGPTILDDILHWREKPCGSLHTTPAPGDDPDPPPPPGKKCVPKPPYYPADSKAAMLQTTVAFLQVAINAEAAHVDPKDGTTNDHGCLDLTKTKCDWSYKKFADEYLHRFTAEREADYAKCMDVTDNDFSETNFPPMKGPAAKIDYTADSDAVDRYFVDAQIERDKILLDYPYDPGGTPNTAGDVNQDGHSLGDPKWFAAGYSYDAEWHVTLARKGTDTTGNFCRVKSGSIKGSLNADITILSQGPITHAPLKVIDGYFEASVSETSTTGTMTTHFDVLSVPQYPARDRQPLEWHLANTKDFGGPKYSVIIPVMGIPVEFGAGADLFAGYKVDASATAPQDCRDGSDMFSIDATFTPEIGVNGTAWAAVNAGLAEVGVEGSINLVTVSLPIHTGARIGMATNPPDPTARMNLALDITSNLALAELSGGIDAFEEVCLPWCGKVEEGIFSWGGLKQTIPLYQHTKNYPIAALRTGKPPKKKP